jgi:hypothetical protein
MATDGAGLGFRRVGVVAIQAATEDSEFPERGGKRVKGWGSICVGPKGGVVSR